MAYIGNGRTLLVLGPNVQDDIIPDGVSSTFTLSLEVPGGYEGNVIVVRKRYLLDNIVLASTAVSIVAPNQIKVLADQDLAAAFSIIQVPTTANDVSNIIIAGATNGINNAVHRVTDVVYNGTDIIITIFGSNLTDESGAALTVNWGRTTDWEVLAPETDYVIGGSIGPNYNQIITFQGGYIPSIDDSVYVIHKGDATYNFVPSQASVGPDQLTQNLRNFVCDRFTGNGSTTTFALTQEAINSKTLLVSIDGIEKDGDDPEQSFIGAWKLNAGGLSITFLTAPANATKIRILHLSFSTVSRRAALSPGQAGAVAAGSVNNAALAANSVTTDKIAPSGVTLTDIAADNVDGSKILLNNNESLRSKDSLSAPQGLLKLSATDRTTLNTPGSSLHLSFSDVNIIDVDAISLSPTTNSGRALGTLTKKWSQLFVLGTTRLGPTEVDSLVANGNGSFNGNITLATPGATVDGVDLTALQATVVQLQADLLAAVPTGSMKMWMVDSSAPAGFLLCNGSAVSRTTYLALFITIGTTFGNGDGSSTFNVPDLRQRFPLGKAASGTGSLWGNINGVGGNIDHTHTGGTHTHDMSSHTHIIPGHFHGMGLGATLNISPSGTHTTSIQHNHGTFNTVGNDGLHGHNLDLGHAITVSTQLDHSHVLSALGTVSSAGSHSHTIATTVTIQSANTAHNHTGTVHVAGDHNHLISANTGGVGGAGSSTSRAFSSDNTNFSRTRTTSTEGSHSHALSIDWLNNQYHYHSNTATSTIAAPEPNHSHTLGGTTNGGGNHSHTLGGAILSHGSAHGHNIDVPDTGALNSSSDGSHSHTAGNFFGHIGNVNSGNDGDSNLNTGLPSAANTGSAGATLTTASNPPFHTVHFIIKT